MDNRPALTNLDWSIDPVIDWLVGEGRLVPDLRQQVESLGQRLVAAGAPLSRLYVGLQVVHPQLVAMAIVWRPGKEAVEIARQHGIDKSPAYIGSPMDELRVTGKPVRYRLTQLPENHHATLDDMVAEGATDYYVIPMPFSRGPLPAVTMCTDRPGGFSDADLAKLTRVFDHFGASAEAQLNYRLGATLMDTYLGRHTGERILQGLIRRGDGETIRAVLWFSDLRNYTGISEALPAEEVLDILNFYFETIGRAIQNHGGDILKFLGDGLLAIFPVQDAMFLPLACAGALRAAQDALADMDRMNAGREAADMAPIRFGVGLHVGTVTYGNVGTLDRLDFTVIGPAVNRCARLQSLTKEAGVPILASAEFNANCPHPLRPVGRYSMRGIEEPQDVFTVGG